MVGRFSLLPEAISDDQLRAQINNYFASQLTRHPKEEERRAAAQATLRKFPELIDYYIRLKEDDGERAVTMAASKVDDTRAVLVEQVKRVLADLGLRTDFLTRPTTSYQESVDRVRAFKAYVEHNDGYKLINRAGRPFSREEEVQLFFGLIWWSTEFDVNREVNNGRGPVDFKVSFGSRDKSLIEFKLASNTSLRRNLQKQLPVYEAANQTRSSVKVIVCYTAQDQRKVAKILQDLKLTGEQSIILIDARSDNKPSGSKA